MAGPFCPSIFPHERHLMPSFHRLIFASLLCGMIVFGQAPAWLHVGSCEGHGHVSASVTQAEMTSSERTVSVCSHGCQHHATDLGNLQPVALPDDSPVSGDQHSDHQHDSESCVICQSLASANGVTWQMLVSVPSEFSSRPVFVAQDRILAANLLSIPQPRGPPTIA